MAKHKRLVIAICVVAALVIAAAAYLFATTPPHEYEAASNLIFGNADGSGQIKVDNINKIIQTHEDEELDGRTLKAGTIIVPGNGDESYYNYPRRDTVKGDN